MDNIITIKFKKKEDGAHDYKIEFESCPTLSELCTCTLLFQQITSHCFDTQAILTTLSSIYPRIRDIEEIRRV